MTPVSTPLQLGLFTQFPPVAAPVAMALGVTALTYWFVNGHVVPLLPLPAPLSPWARFVLTVPVAFGAVLVTFGFAGQADVFWTYALIVSLFGKVIEASVAVYGLRKLAYYVREANAKLRQRLSGGGSEDDAGPSFRWRVWMKVYQVILYSVARLFILVFVVGGAIYLTHALTGLQYSLAADWAIFVAAMSLTTLLYNTRHIRHEIGLAALVGILFSIVGAELYNYPSGLVPVPAPVEDLLGLVPPGSLLAGLLSGFSTSELAVLLLNQVAYAAGFALAVVFVLVAPAPGRFSLTKAGRE